MTWLEDIRIAIADLILASLIELNNGHWETLTRKPCKPPYPGLTMANVHDDLRITRIVCFNLTSHRPKMVGNNAVGGVHNDHAKERMVRLFTNTGIEGLGRCYVPPQILVSLLGRNPFDFYQADKKRIQSSLGVHTMPLWDLMGKALSKPVYELLGDDGKDRVPAYDGSIYFSDLMPEHQKIYADRFKWEIDLGLERGFRAFKVKVGRGYRWMERYAGDARDVEVLNIIREHAGPDIQIGVDANNGYDFEGTKKFVRATANLNFLFIEEMFPEEISQCLEMKAFLAENSWQMLLADGETQSTPVGLKPFIEAGAIDVLQGDMNTFGIEGIMMESEWTRGHDIKVAPHNWGSLLGFYLQCHIARAIPNFFMAECDPLDSDVVHADGYNLEDGHVTVSDEPGFGLHIDDAQFTSSSDVEVLFEL